MKIESGRGVASSTGARRAGSAAAPDFAPGAEAPQRAVAANSVAAATPLDAIMALQAEGPDGQRRRRQTRRGRDVLDALERLARALALGAAPVTLRADLENLRRGAEATGEEGLDALMREIDTRLAVEIAKLDMGAGRA